VVFAFEVVWSIVGGVPAALTALVPGNRAVRRTRAGEIVGPGAEIAELVM
jgi:hypothetical protein